MQELRKNSYAAASCGLLIIVSLLNILISTITDADLTKQIIQFLIGIVLILAVSFVKEFHIYESALPAYICSVIILIVQLLFGDKYNLVSNCYIHIGSFSFYTASLLPLTLIQISKFVTKCNGVSSKGFAAACALFFVPIGLVFAQNNMTPVAVAIIAFFIGVIILKKENRISTPWRLLAIPFIASLILFVVLYSKGSYFTKIVDVVLTRGDCDPLGSGWVRKVLDRIFIDTPLVAESVSAISKKTLIAMLAQWEDCNIVIALVQYGWIAFISILIVYLALFICIFKMAIKTNQSMFAKHSSLFLALSLFSQAAYSLISLFLLNGVHLNMPFMGEYSINLINYLSFGIILLLYLKRGQPSMIEETRADADPHKLSLFEKIRVFTELTDDGRDDNSK